MDPPTEWTPGSGGDWSASDLAGLELRLELCYPACAGAPEFRVRGRGALTPPPGKGGGEGGGAGGGAGGGQSRGEGGGGRAPQALVVASPRLWWPNGYGKQELYELIATLCLSEVSRPHPVHIPQFLPPTPCARPAHTLQHPFNALSTALLTPLNTLFTPYSRPSRPVSATRRARRRARPVGRGRGRAGRGAGRRLYHGKAGRRHHGRAMRGRLRRAWAGRGGTRRGMGTREGKASRCPTRRKERAVRRRTTRARAARCWYGAWGCAPWRSCSGRRRRRRMARRRLVWNGANQLNVP